MTTPEAPAAGSPPVFRRLAGRGAIYSIGSAVQAVGAIAILPIVTRSLEPSEFGVVTAATVVIQLLSTLIALGLAAPILRSWYDDGGQLRSRQVYGFSIVAVAGMSLVAHLTGPGWANLFEDVGYGTPLQLAVVIAAVTAIVLNGQALVRAHDAARTFVLQAVAMAVIGPGLGAVLVGPWGVDGYLIGLVAGYVVALGLGLALDRPRFRGALGGGIVRPALAMGLPVLPHSLALWVIYAADRIVIEHIDGTADAGRYQVAYLIGSGATTLLLRLTQMWGPMLYEAGEEGVWPLLTQTSTYVTGAAVGLMALGVLGAPTALVLVLPPSYDPRELIWVAVTVAAAIIPFTLFQCHAQIVFVVRRTWWIGVITPVSAAMNIGLTILLVTWWGLIGAAVATFATYAVQEAMISVAGRREATVPWRRGMFLGAWATVPVGVAVGGLLPPLGWGLAVRIALAIALAAVGAVIVARQRAASPVASPAG